jgi:hypothetical protein
MDDFCLEHLADEVLLELEMREVSWVASFSPVEQVLLVWADEGEELLLPVVLHLENQQDLVGCLLEHELDVALLRLSLLVVVAKTELLLALLRLLDFLLLLCLLNFLLRFSNFVLFINLFDQLRFFFLNFFVVQHLD